MELPACMAAAASRPTREAEVQFTSFAVRSVGPEWLLVPRVLKIELRDGWLAKRCSVCMEPLPCEHTTAWGTMTVAGGIPLESIRSDSLDPNASLELYTEFQMLALSCGMSHCHPIALE